MPISENAHLRKRLSQKRISKKTPISENAFVKKRLFHKYTEIFKENPFKKKKFILFIRPLVRNALWEKVIFSAAIQARQLIFVKISLSYKYPA